MIKAVKHLDDGRILVVLGLSLVNVAELRMDRPIVFHSREIQLPLDIYFGIAFKHGDGRIVAPNVKCMILISFDNEIVEMLSQPNAFALIDEGPILVQLMLGRDEEELHARFRGNIGPETKVTRKGYAPSDVPPGEN